MLSVTSAKSDVWRTPVDLVTVLAREFRFLIDGAADINNKIGQAPAYFGLDHPMPAYRDALAVAWWDVLGRLARQYPGDRRAAALFLNPPFSLLDEFIAKAGDEKKHGVTTVAVLPNRVEKGSWQDDLAVRASEIRTLRGRLKYWRICEPGESMGRGVGAWIAKGGELIEDSAFFSSSVVIWRGFEPTMIGGPRSTFWDWRREIAVKSSAPGAGS